MKRILYALALITLMACASAPPLPPALHFDQPVVLLGEVLLAGNGHVRTDVGAPRWLSADLRARSLAVGVLEQGDTTAAFDRRVFTAPQPRPDPCAAFRVGLQR
ncbi:MAG TPA: hypothetical protein VK439_03865 [Rubrivivax sp.]|nr:hypothetical protein [Rubrivivax sp.]